MSHLGTEKKFSCMSLKIISHLLPSWSLVVSCLIWKFAKCHHEANSREEWMWSNIHVDDERKAKKKKLEHFDRQTKMQVSIKKISFLEEGGRCMSSDKTIFNWTCTRKFSFNKIFAFSFAINGILSLCQRLGGEFKNQGMETFVKIYYNKIKVVHPLMQPTFSIEEKHYHWKFKLEGD